MKATELRIGNLICREDLGDSHERFETIIELGKKVKTTGPINVICSYDEIKPVPLTEEWLQKFGFDDSDYKKNHIGKTFKGGGVFLDFVLRKPLSMGPWNKNFTYDLGNHRYVDLPFVHSLQNFYFALTGEDINTQY